MEIRRDDYLEEIKAVMHNGLVKVITGIRRCGKSYFLFTIFRNYLKSIGIDDEQIVSVQLDDDDFEELRSPKALSKYIKDRILADGRNTYVLIDEIQECKPLDGSDGITFYDVLNSLMKKKGVDIYVTGSNSEMLSEDIATNFRDRGTVIRMWPLSFSEYYGIGGKEKSDAWEDYLALSKEQFAAMSDAIANWKMLKAKLARLEELSRLVIFRTTPDPRRSRRPTKATLGLGKRPKSP